MTRKSIPALDYANLRVIRNEGKARETFNTLAASGTYYLGNRYFTSYHGGRGLLEVIKIGEDEVIFEAVMGEDGSDLVMTLYHTHPIFNSHADLASTRATLIELVEEMRMAAPGRLTMLCRARNRTASLKELSTIQLVETLMVLTAKGAS
jgi:hypothetical protein